VLLVLGNKYCWLWRGVGLAAAKSAVLSKGCEVPLPCFNNDEDRETGSTGNVAGNILHVINSACASVHPHAFTNEKGYKGYEGMAYRTGLWLIGSW